MDLLPFALLRDIGLCGPECIKYEIFGIQCVRRTQLRSTGTCIKLLTLVGCYFCYCVEVLFDLTYWQLSKRRHFVDILYSCVKDEKHILHDQFSTLNKYCSM